MRISVSHRGLCKDLRSLEHQGLKNLEPTCCSKLTGVVFVPQAGMSLPFSEGAIVMPALHPDYAGGIFAHLYASRIVIQELLAVSGQL